MDNLFLSLMEIYLNGGPNPLIILYRVTVFAALIGMPVGIFLIIRAKRKHKNSIKGWIVLTVFIIRVILFWVLDEPSWSNV